MARSMVGGERWGIFLVGLTTFFLFADQNLMAPNLTQIARDFGLSDLERDQKLGGDIALVFWMLGGVVSLTVGYLTDRIPRRALFAAILFVGEIPCFLTGFARDYDDLFWLRAATGLGIGGAMPILYSLLGDWFSAKNRAKATAVLGFSMGLGIALGQLIAGFLGPTYGWRLPFIVVSAPNFLLSILFLLTTREPVRGQSEEALAALAAEGHVAGGRFSLADYLGIFRVRSNVLVFLQGIPGTVPWGVFFVFLNDFYAQEKGYPVEVATLIVMAIGGAAILGGLVGGLVGGRLYNRDPRLLPLFCGLSTLVGVVPTLALLNYPSQIGVAEPDAGVPILLGLLTGFTVSITSANVRVILLNVNGPDARGSVFSLFNLADDLGKGFGPAVIALLIGVLGRVMAFNVATLFWLFCGAVLIALAWSFPKDEAALQARLRARLEGGAA